MNIDRLGQYVASVLEDRGLSQSDLARMANVSRSSISGLIGAYKKPSINLVMAIAKALNIPPETLYHEAGLLPEKTGDALDKLNFMIEQLDDDDRQEVFDFIELKIKRKEKHDNSNRLIDPAKFGG